MSDFPRHASAVIIGAGIVGNSLAYHLARLGWTDLVLVDKGPLPSPGGSTGHASNFIFPVEYSRMMAELTLDSVAQYQELGVFARSGGLEVARTEARMQELRRRCGAATARGIPARPLSPAEVGKLVPYLDESVILGGAHFPGAGVVDPMRAGTLLRERAELFGALQVMAETEVTGISIAADGRVSGVRTDGGDIETELCVICCGVWSPRIAAMAGARIPLTPVVHQMISAGPCELFASSSGEIEYPVVRDMDAGMYERQRGELLQIGSYAHRPIIVSPEDIPGLDDAEQSPTELPFTAEDFAPQLAQARELMPELLGDDRAEICYSVNGLIAMTPDGRPVLGETPEVPGLWSAAASWIKEGPGIGRAVAEWMSGVPPQVDLHEADIARFAGHERTSEHVTARARESFNAMYGIVHPAQQWQSGRPLRISPVHQRAADLGAVFTETAGWERPAWYAANEALLGGYAGRLMEREGEWESRWWSPVINAEHLAMRERCGLVDLTSLAVFDVTGPGALSTVQSLAARQLDVPAGGVVHTPMLDEAGGVRADVTVMRLGRRRFRVVTGPATGMLGLSWIIGHLPADESASVADLTSAWATFGLWGPLARDVLGAVTGSDVSNAGFPLGTCRELELGGCLVLAARTSPVGELGWELHVPVEQGARVWDTLWDAGLPHQLVAVGDGVYGTTARLEKGRRRYGTELDSGYTLVEAGLAGAPLKQQDFIGRAACLGQRAAGPCAVLCTLTVNDHRSPSGELRYMLGGEPVLSADGEPLTDAKGRTSYVTSAGSAPSLGKHLLMAYLPADQATPGRQLAVEYLGERYPVSVAVAGVAPPLFDPDDSRMSS
jgi:glycine cleavage system aminomethyltransferase T/glycine/D-amino acid oxidase-like deaminating enzyme